MDKERIDIITKAAKDHMAAYYRNERSYQDSGINRYYNAMYKHETIAEALERYLSMDEIVTSGNTAKGKIHAWGAMLQDFEYKPEEMQKRIVSNILAEIRMYCAY